MAFFTTTDTGTTTNRFSQDLELIDMELPTATGSHLPEYATPSADNHRFTDHFIVLSVLIAQLLVIASSAKYVSIALPLCIAAVWMIQKFYLSISLRLRILDIEAKSQLFTSFLELLNGLTTIRAFGWETQHLLRARAAIAVSQRPFYLLYSIQRWLNLVLDLVVGAVAILLVTIAVEFQGSSDAGLIGLALVSLAGFSQILKQLVTNWTLLETSAGA